MPANQSDSELHHDIARDIGQQVEMMILDAKHQSEAKVGKELQKVKAKMMEMSDKIKAIGEGLTRLEPPSTGLLKADLQKSITKLEEVWEAEVGTLKHELWQTIQAHNHNADLLKHHKDAIDEVQGRVQETADVASHGGAGGISPQVHAQMMEMDKIIQREQAKEDQMEQFVARLAAVQQKIVNSVGPWPSPGQMPGLAGAASQATAAQVQAAAAQVQAAAAAGNAKKPQRKEDAASKKAAKAQAKSKQAAKANSAAALQAAAAASLRAEAPEFVPTTPGWAEPA